MTRRRRRRSTVDGTLDDLDVSASTRSSYRAAPSTPTGSGSRSAPQQIVAGDRGRQAARGDLPRAVVARLGGPGEGRRLTSYHSLADDVRNAGGTWVDEEVVVDGTLITSRNPDDLPAFIRPSRTLSPERTKPGRVPDPARWRVLRRTTGRAVASVSRRGPGRLGAVGGELLVLHVEEDPARQPRRRASCPEPTRNASLAPSVKIWSTACRVRTGLRRRRPRLPWTAWR